MERDNNEKKHKKHGWKTKIKKKMDEILIFSTENHETAFLAFVILLYMLKTYTGLINQMNHCTFGSVCLSKALCWQF